MRARWLPLLLAAACVDPQPLDGEVLVTGDVPGEGAALTEAFLASGARFGVVVDPASGDVTALRRLDRAVNSGDFTQIDATCVDCGGANSGCTGPAGLGRRLEVALVREQGSGPVGVVYRDARNWAPTGEQCDGGACPAPQVDASGGPVAFDVALLGTMGACASFAVYFDTDDA